MENNIQVNIYYGFKYGFINILVSTYRNVIFMY